MWKNFQVQKLPDKDPIMEAVTALCKTSPVCAALERSPRWLDFWIIRQTARTVTSTVYGAEANTDEFHSHASVSAKTLVTRSLADRAIRAVEAAAALGSSQARWEAASAQPSRDARGMAHSSQTGTMARAALTAAAAPIQLHQQNVPQRAEQSYIKVMRKKAPQKVALNIREFLKLLQKV